MAKSRSTKRRRSPLLSFRARQTSWWLRIRTMLFGAIFFILATAALLFQVPPPGQVALSDGDVSPSDIRAPRRFTYFSDLLTERERALAEQRVEDIYDPPQARIARQQIERARSIIYYVDLVRADPYASFERKAFWLANISDIPLTSPTIDTIIAFDDPTWRAASNEILDVLDRAMREEIRSTRLEAVRRSVPAMVSPQFTEDENQVITLFVQGLLRPNTFFNAEKTAEARRRAIEAVGPISRSFEEGEVILRAGDIVDALDVEALQELGLQQDEITWGDVAGAAGYLLLCCIWLGLFLFRYADEFWINQRYSVLLFVLLLVFTGLAMLMVPGHVLLPYLFPMAALSMLVTVLINFQLSLVATLVMTMIVGYMSGGSLEITVYVLLAGLVGPLVLGRAERLSAYLWAGLFVSVINLAVIMTFRLPAQRYDLLGMLSLLGAGLGNGFLSASFTLASFYFIGSVFGITTNLRLMELSRPTQPLLRELLLNAPGSYHHSIMVSNIAEEAANRIGADALLTRVGAYYHDIGKIRRPYFFIENQMDGVNVHDKLDPKTSAQIIRQHVEDGITLAREYTLPRQIQAFIPEHHGTTVATYFYNLALEAEEDSSQVNIDDYRYPGPKPQSRETALVMLADGCESAVRSSRPTSGDQIDEIVRKMIHSRLVDGQLDECELTMKDLERIREAFVQMLQSVFHPRIQYPPGTKEVAKEPKKTENVTPPGKAGELTETPAS